MLRKIAISVGLAVLFTFGLCAKDRKILIDADSAAFQWDPDFLDNYFDARKRCTFEKYEASSVNGAGCANVGVEICEVNSSLSEGEGYFRIIRVGSFTSTGGNQEWLCVVEGDGAPLRKEVTYVTRSLIVNTEPYTGMVLSFPPL